MKSFKIILTALLLISLTACSFCDSPRSMREMRQLVPEMIEIFEQSREHLDVLRNGEFVNLGRAEISGDLFISYRNGRRGAPYEGWDTIEWLTDKEREAILFLMRSEELSHNFELIFSCAGGATLGAELYRNPPECIRVFDVIDIWYGEGENLRLRSHGVLFHGSYSVDLGSGYTLWAYTARAISPAPVICRCRR